MFTLINKNIIYILLAVVVFFGAFLRIYGISDIPPSLSWDEVAVGYNSYAVSNFGIDEWGKRFPVVFKSFGEYKNPVHIYIGAIFVKLFGLNDFSTRLPSAFFGVLNIILIFYFVKKVFKNSFFALLSSFVFAISPYNIQFSRFNHELNFALFFFLLGLIFFYETLTKKHFFTISVICFLVSFVSYSAAKMFVPLFLIFLFTLHIKEIKKLGRFLLPAIVSLMLLAVVVFFNPSLLGLERLRQTTQGEDEIKRTQTFKITNNILLGRFQLVATNYLKHFEYEYLFVSGDTNPRHSIQTIGEFYKIEFLFLLTGLVTIIYKIFKDKDKRYLVLLAWGLMAPIPASIGGEVPHAARSMFVNGIWHIVSGFGLYTIVSLVKNKIFKVLVMVLFLFVFTFQFKNYINDLFVVYPFQYAIEWQYGMKEIAQYIKANQSTYHSIYITNVRNQPYIFLLYNLKYSPTKFSKSVIYNQKESRNSNLVLSFGKFNFDWEVIESQPVLGVLYVLSPYEYSGLRFKDSFDIKKVIKYPVGGDAFYLISAKVEEYE